MEKERKSTYLYLRITESDKKALIDAATEAKCQSVSEYIRSSVGMNNIKTYKYNQFDRLIGKSVYAQVDDDVIVYGKVESVRIEDWYFYEKNESISVLVTLRPEDPYTGCIDDYIDIPLEHIRL